MQLIPSTFIIAQSALEMKKVFIKQLLIVGSLCLAKKKRNLKPSYLPAFIFISATSKLLHYFLDFTAMFFVLLLPADSSAHLQHNCTISILNWMVGHVSTQSELKFNHIRVFNRFFPPQFSSMNSNPIYIQIHITQLRLAVILQ